MARGRIGVGCASGAGLAALVCASSWPGAAEAEPAVGTPAWYGACDQAAAEYGRAVAAAGDVDGDGFHDIVVAASSYDYVGAVWLHAGSASGLVASPSWMAESDYAGALGGSLDSAGDVNGDGFDDVVTGGPGSSIASRGAGEARVYLGSGTGLNAAPAWSDTGEVAYAEFGYSVAGAGDTNGDGFDDVLISAPYFDGELDQQGKVYLYLGYPDGIEADEAWSLLGTHSGDRIGEPISGAGDVNGDGYADAIVSSPSHSTYGVGVTGLVEVYLGTVAGLEASPLWTGRADSEGLGYGYAVSSAGDVNADGFADILVGEPYLDGADEASGAALLYLGGASGPEASPSWTAQGSSYLEMFGTALATAGDVNADGFADVIIGSPQYRGGADFSGLASVFFGSSTGLGATPGWLLGNTTGGDALGQSVSTAGDVDNDGYDDVIAGAPVDNGGRTEGRAYLYMGPSGGADADGDGYGPISAEGSDCDDTAATTYPGAPEVCDGVDQDCDGVPDDDAIDAIAWHPDQDGDGYGDPETSTSSCTAPPGSVQDNTDCDDASPAIHPGATEVCDPANTDEDCDTLADDADPSVDPATQTVWFPDADADGYGAVDAPSASCDPPADARPDGTDCDDADPDVHPDALEACGNDLDDDCDPQTTDTCPVVEDTGTPPKSGCGCASGPAPTRGILLLLLGIASSASRRRRP